MADYRVEVFSFGFRLSSPRLRPLFVRRKHSVFLMKNLKASRIDIRLSFRLRQQIVDARRFGLTILHVLPIKSKRHMKKVNVSNVEGSILERSFLQSITIICVPNAFSAMPLLLSFIPSVTLAKCWELKGPERPAGTGIQFQKLNWLRHRNGSCTGSKRKKR